MSERNAFVFFTSLGGCKIMITATSLLAHNELFYRNNEALTLKNGS